MQFHMTAVLGHSRSPTEILFVMGIIVIVGGLVMAFNLFQRKVWAESIEEPNPLDRGWWSNLKRSYLAESKLKWPRYVSAAIILCGVIIVILAGLLYIIGHYSG